MNFLPADPRDAAFKAELEGLFPNISRDLSQVATLPEHRAEQILEVVLSRGCKAQHSRNIVLGREAAKEMPRDWVVAWVEKLAERVLNLEDEWEYRRLLELYRELDSGLVQRLVARGLVSEEDGIRVAVEDFRCHDAAAG